MLDVVATLTQNGVTVGVGQQVTTSQGVQNSISIVSVVLNETTQGVGTSTR